MLYLHIIFHVSESDFKNIQYVQDLSSRDCDVQGRQKIVKDAVNGRENTLIFCIFALGRRLL